MSQSVQCCYLLRRMYIGNLYRKFVWNYMEYNFLNKYASFVPYKLQTWRVYVGQQFISRRGVE
jgi:hypothetical protein